MENILKGIITHSISGFYYVEAADKLYECKARGLFRKNNYSPLVGDIVDIDITDGTHGTVINIYDRKNFLQRPPVANIDILFIVSSVERPKPNLYVTDKLSAFSVKHNIKPVMIFSKVDLADADYYREIYKKAGFDVILTSVDNKTGLDEITSYLENNICVFCGNSGVGKSSLINALLPEFSLETNDISDKLGRGKHTTRSVSLYKAYGGFVVDTPGFSSIDFEKNSEKILKEELCDYFPDFLPFAENCRFYPSCTHTGDRGCAVCDAVKQNLISEERYSSYLRMYEEVKNVKKWD